MRVNRTRQHSQSKHCQDGKVRKRRRERELQNIRDLKETFHVGGQVLENVDTFLYLGRVISADDNDCPTVMHT